jgi:hypothetical protein
VFRNELVFTASNTKYSNEDTLMGFELPLLRGCSYTLVDTLMLRAGCSVGISSKLMYSGSKVSSKPGAIKCEKNHPKTPLVAHHFWDQKRQSKAHYGELPIHKPEFSFSVYK